MRKVGRVRKNCLVCKKEILLRFKETLTGRGKYCSQSCKGMGWNTSKENNPRWNNGVKIHNYGYRLIASPNHPNKDKQGYVREHRLVMEKHIGRYLLPTEDVHHLDGNKQNNDINNLVLFSSRSEHLKTYHQEGGKKGWFQKSYVNI